MFVSLYYQRRRLAVCALLIALAYIINHGWSDTTPLSLSIQVLAFTGIITCISAVVVHRWPQYRQYLEVAYLTYILILLLEKLLAANGISIAMDQLQLCAGAIMGPVMFQLIYGLWWNKTSIRIPCSLRTEFSTQASPQEVWRRCTPYYPQDYYTGTLRNFILVENEQELYLHQICTGEDQYMNLFAQVEESEPNQSFKMRFTGPIDDAFVAKDQSGAYALTITQGNARTKVTVTENVDSASLPVFLNCWMDDLSGEIKHRMLAALEGRIDKSLWAREARRQGALNT